MSFYDIMLAEKLGGGGGITPTGTKDIIANGMYDVASFANADVDVPNTYTPSDEGKVVSNGALVSQSSVTKTANGTYDTTLNNFVTVDVPQPTGTISITQNGTGIDVAQYALADVDVSGGGGVDMRDIATAELTNLVIPSTTGYIAGYAFYGYVDLKSITFPSVFAGSGNINKCAFYNCKEVNVPIILPSNVANIKEGAFQLCGKIPSIDIGANIKTIEADAFYYCRSLTSITVRATTPPTLESSSLNGVPSNANIYVPAGSVEAYKTATNWSARASYIQAIT